MDGDIKVCNIIAQPMNHVFIDGKPVLRMISYINISNMANIFSFRLIRARKNRSMCGKLVKL